MERARAQSDVPGVEQCYWRLWQLLPEPKFIWSESTIMVTNFALHFLRCRNFDKALAWAPNLIGLFETTSEEYAAVLAGRIYFEAGQQTEAVKWFEKAYKLGGRGAFRGENLRYVELVESRPRSSGRSKPRIDEWPTVPDSEAHRLMVGPISLDNQVHQQIEALCAQGDVLSGSAKFDEAVAKYKEALLLLPRPIEKWDASTWIYTAIGDALFLKGDYVAAAIPLRDVMYCPGAEENAFIRLRRGQVAFEKGNLAVAEKELKEAYRLAGVELFTHDDPKYLVFLKSVLQ